MWASPRAVLEKALSSCNNLLQSERRSLVPVPLLRHELLQLPVRILKRVPVAVSIIDSAGAAEEKREPMAISERVVVEGCEGVVDYVRIR
jgi:hypothetical protein